MRFGLCQKDIAQIISVFKNCSNIKKVIIFGSRAMGNYKKGSDVDLAIMGKLASSELSRIKSILEEELPLPYRFDLVEYSQAMNPALKNHIDIHGKVFYFSKQ